MLSRRFTILVGFILIAQTSHSQPSDAVKRYRAGYELLKARNFRNADIELDQAVTIDSTYGAAYFLLGQANEYLKD